MDDLQYYKKRKKAADKVFFFLREHGAIWDVENDIAENVAEAFNYQSDLSAINFCLATRGDYNKAFDLLKYRKSSWECPTEPTLLSNWKMSRGEQYKSTFFVGLYKIGKQVNKAQEGHTFCSALTKVVTDAVRCDLNYKIKELKRR